MAIRGLNHITLAVAELERSLSFYVDILGLALRARWQGGAYVEAGDLWLCLSVDAEARNRPHPDYTHLAFDASAEDFEAMAGRVRDAAAPEWKVDRSEGASIYFLDPDGHKLELHVGSLRTRLDHWRRNPPPGLTVPERGGISDNWTAAGQPGNDAVE